ncbi:MAG TPA: hypothetical protein VMS17_24185 [Gemmataceae bacterium]|nr:hypothetical protein [Gemmataceae bacterium]
MNQAIVDRIVNAVLYEGYVLYPYRPSVKNRQRWTFGGVYPRSYCEAQQTGDAWEMQTECLVRGERPVLNVTVRFLHLQARRIGALDHPRKRWVDGERAAFHFVDSLRAGDTLLQTWQEAVERKVLVPGLCPGTHCPAGSACRLDHTRGRASRAVRSQAEPGNEEVEEVAAVEGRQQTEFAFPGGRRIEPVRGPQDEIIGVVVREQQSVGGLVKTSVEPAGAQLFKVRVRIENRSPLANAGVCDRDEALLRSLVSTHTILGVRDGEFLSLLEPPAEHALVAAGCRNEGAFPVLVGEAGERDAILSSPIILYDYPRTAPESPGDLFDGAEIDEILSLRILTLTDEEKRSAAAVDERVRALLQRTAGLTPEQFLGLHGTVRGLRTLPAEDGHA